MDSEASRELSTKIEEVLPQHQVELVKNLQGLTSVYATANLLNHHQHGSSFTEAVKNLCDLPLENITSAGVTSAIELTVTALQIKAEVDLIKMRVPQELETLSLNCAIQDVQNIINRRLNRPIIAWLKNALGLKLVTPAYALFVLQVMGQSGFLTREKSAIFGKKLEVDEALKGLEKKIQEENNPLASAHFGSNVISASFS